MITALLAPYIAENSKLFRIDSVLAQTTVLTPIARVDVIPHQRIGAGETFNFGVIAFSKNGIDRIEYTIAGQGYTGQATVQANAMTYNARTDVHEYWIPIRAADFMSDGVFIVSVVAYGQDGGMRDLGQTPLVVDHTGTLAQPQAWVSNSGSNSSGTLGNPSMPFATIEGAVLAIHAAHGGQADGGIVYLLEGTYDFAGAWSSQPVTSHEWLTIRNDTNAAKENTIIDDGGPVSNTTLLKVEGVTLTSSATDDYIFSTGTSNLWVNNSRILGPDPVESFDEGRWIVRSNPIHSGVQKFMTDTYIYDVDRAFGTGPLARGLNIEHIGEDAFQNAPFVVNCRLHDQWPGLTYWHADAFQQWGTGKENTIVYNYYVTDAHYQGLFMRATDSMARNNAFVNNFVEMRKPGGPGYEGGPIVHSNTSFYGPWDHLVFWNNTLPTANSAILEDTAGYGFTNSSFIGNVFYQINDAFQPIGQEPDYALPGNVQNNEFFHNHYTLSYTDLPPDHSCGWPIPEGCPHIHSKSMDTDPNGSQSTGDPMLDISTLAQGVTVSSTFGTPLAGSPLIDRIDRVTVPADVFGNPRDATPDVGAIEYVSAPFPWPMFMPAIENGQQ